MKNSMIHLSLMYSSVCDENIRCVLSDFFIIDLMNGSYQVANEEEIKNIS